MRSGRPSGTATFARSLGGGKPLSSSARLSSICLRSFQFGDMVHGFVLDHLRSLMILEHLQARAQFEEGSAC